MINPLIVAALYLIASLAAFLAFYSISRKISGPSLNHGRFWLFFAILILWGANQLGVARYGYIFLYPSSKDFFGSDYIIRWVAFISALLQTLCLPSKVTPRYWFSRK
jgi:hypothetical protein